jgi:predicted dehydrogenase
MSQLPPDLGLNIHPTLPRRKDWRIGCLGSGFIMRDCHLVAYRNARFNPIAIASRNPEHAREVAGRHSIPTVHESIDALLADSQIEILDIAVPPDVQPDLLRRAVQLGKGRLRGILAQKPLAFSSAVARDLVKVCQDAGIVLAVNQNMRFDQSVRAARDILSRGWLGEVVLATIDMRAIPHWMPWAQGQTSLSTFIMSIHHLDTFRYWLGTPDRVLASTRTDPRTKFPHRDGINLYILEYDSGPRASAWDDVWTGPSREGAASDISINWRVEGTDGLMMGTIGWPRYPDREPSTLIFSSNQKRVAEALGVPEKEPGPAHVGGRWYRPKWDSVWFPDAFVGTMAQLLVAVENGTEPEISGRDNVETIYLCEAVLRAARDHEVVRMADLMGVK